MGHNRTRTLSLSSTTQNVTTPPESISAAKGFMLVGAIGMNLMAAQGACISNMPKVVRNESIRICAYEPSNCCRYDLKIKSKEYIYDPVNSNCSVFYTTSPERQAAKRDSVCNRADLKEGFLAMVNKYIPSKLLGCGVAFLAGFILSCAVLVNGILAGAFIINPVYSLMHCVGFLGLFITVIIALIERGRHIEQREKERKRNDFNI